MPRLVAAQAFAATGTAAALPIVPLFIAHRGGSATAVALFVAVPMAVNTAAQVPFGRLIDRVGAGTVLPLSRFAVAMCCVPLIIGRGPIWLLTLIRCCQAACEGGYLPALRTAVSQTTVPDARATQFAQIQAATMTGLIAGPLIGGTVGVLLDTGPFAVTALASFICAALTVGATGRSNPEQTVVSPQRLPRYWWMKTTFLAPSISLAFVAAVGAMFTVVWPQYVASRGYGPLTTGITLALYAAPFLLIQRLVGLLEDRFSRRSMTSLCLIAAGLCTASYPLVFNLGIISLLLLIQAGVEVVIEPSLFAAISESVGVEARGRALALGGVFEFSGGALGAATLGSLYGFGPALPFVLSGGLLFCGALLSAWLSPREVSREWVSLRFLQLIQRHNASVSIRESDQADVLPLR